MFAVLGLGLLVGMQHALEADHVAAVASIAARRSRVGDVVKQGLTWGFGHTITLFLFAGAAIVLGQVIPEALAEWFETIVGLMLIALGAHVLWRLRRDRVHFHSHSHGDETMHLHAHSHVSELESHGERHHEQPHDHEHGFNWRSLLVGLVHGMAGSAALLVLAASQVENPWLGLAYIVLFGVGSMIGMGVLSIVIAVPLSVSAQFLTWSNRALQFVIGSFAICLGGWTVFGHTLQGYVL